jgi:hypothetical protein
MSFLLALCVIALAFAQDTSSTTSSSLAQTTGAETTGVASSTSSSAVQMTTGVATGSCADRIAACQAASTKCGNSLAVICGCKKTEAACLPADCADVAKLKESIEFTCFQVGCGLDCSHPQGGCNLAGIGVNCPADLAGCRGKALTDAAKCDCEAKYFKCVDASNTCPDYDKAFTSKLEECRKLCPVEKCQLAGAAAVAMAPIATIVAAMALMFSN